MSDSKNFNGLAKSIERPQDGWLILPALLQAIEELPVPQGTNVGSEVARSYARKIAKRYSTSSRLDGVASVTSEDVRNNILNLRSQDTQILERMRAAAEEGGTRNQIAERVNEILQSANAIGNANEVTTDRHTLREYDAGLTLFKTAVKKLIDIIGSEGTQTFFNIKSETEHRDPIEALDNVYKRCAPPERWILGAETQMILHPHHPSLSYGTDGGWTIASSIAASELVNTRAWAMSHCERLTGITYEAARDRHVAHLQLRSMQLPQFLNDANKRQRGSSEDVAKQLRALQREMYSDTHQDKTGSELLDFIHTEVASGRLLGAPFLIYRPKAKNSGARALAAQAVPSTSAATKSATPAATTTPSPASSNGGTAGRNRNRCSYCKQEGHNISECTDTRLRCRKCEGLGHHQSRCPAPTAPTADGADQ